MRQVNAAVFVQIFSGESIGPKTTTASDETFQPIGVSRVQTESCFDRIGTGLARKAAAESAIKGGIF